MIDYVRVRFPAVALSIIAPIWPWKHLRSMYVNIQGYSWNCTLGFSRIEWITELDTQTIVFQSTLLRYVVLFTLLNFHAFSKSPTSHDPDSRTVLATADIQSVKSLSSRRIQQRAVPRASISAHTVETGARSSVTGSRNDADNFTFTTPSDTCALGLVQSCGNKDYKI
jgi:hypothetical protein